MDLLDLKRNGACRGVDTNVFFPTTEDEAGPALGFCARCDLADACLRFAMTTHQDDGVWGGTTEKDRRRIRAGRVRRLSA